jgi:hypothetical protein
MVKKFIVLSNYNAVVGIYMVTYLTCTEQIISNSDSNFYVKERKKFDYCADVRMLKTVIASHHYI